MPQAASRWIGGKQKYEVLHRHRGLHQGPVHDQNQQFIVGIEEESLKSQKDCTMALPISIERLLDGHTVEGHRVEFKEGWNPAPIYRSICAFANDISNEGGGYIVIGVEEVDGLSIRPVKGISLEQIEPLGKEMISFNNLIKPVYHPKTSIEEIDGKTVFVIWCPAGQDRPYEVPDDVTVKEKKYNYRVRYNSSSIVPKGQLLRELLDLANDTPFDDRANTLATIADVSQTLVRDFLVKTGSKLAQQIETEPFRNILEAMELLAGPREAIYPRNVALMMFNDHPEKFLPLKAPLTASTARQWLILRPMSSRRMSRSAITNLKQTGHSTTRSMRWKRLSETAFTTTITGKENLLPLR